MARSYTRADLQYLADEELAALLGVITDVRDQALFQVAYYHGLRASEVGLITLADLNLKTGRIRVTRLKNGNSGEYVMTDRERAVLAPWLALRGPAPGPLFPGRRGRPIGRQRLDELMKKYGELAGLAMAKRHFHVLRHTCGTKLGELADAVEVQDHMGHKNISSTMIYLRVRNQRRIALGERLASKW
jgi:type 1 fimbriae regulatory protein FimB